MIKQASEDWEAQVPEAADQASLITEDSTLAVLGHKRSYLNFSWADSRTSSPHVGTRSLRLTEARSQRRNTVTCFRRLLNPGCAFRLPGELVKCTLGHWSQEESPPGMHQCEVTIENHCSKTIVIVTSAWCLLPDI